MSNQPGLLENKNISLHDPQVFFWKSSRFCRSLKSLRLALAFCAAFYGQENARHLAFFVTPLFSPMGETRHLNRVTRSDILILSTFLGVIANAKSKLTFSKTVKSGFI